MERGATVKLYPDIIQQSEEWFAMREWRPTASNASKILTAGGKDSTSWLPYILGMIDSEVRPRAVREAGLFQGNRHTDRGNEMEGAARSCFAERAGVDVAEVGFVTRDDGIWGCSPDGLVMDRKTQQVIAGVEIKCPDGPKHLGHLDGGGLPADYLQQVHCSMVVTGLRLWFFVSYCEYYQPLILKVQWDSYTDKMAGAMDRFQAFYRAERPRLLAFSEGRAA